MMQTLRRRLAALAIVVCCAGGMLGWAAILAAHNYTNVTLQDWIVYYAAGTAAREGQFALLYDGWRFTDFQAELLAQWFAGPPSLHPWLYPPPFLLLLAPLSLLPFAAAYAAFLVPTLAATLTALVRRGGRWDWPRAAILLFFPGTLTNVLTGQNAFLSAGLMIGGIRLLERRPVAGGALLGVLAYKPQLYLLVPLALAAARTWRGLAASLLMAVAVAAVSATVFGLPAWFIWFGQTVRAEDPSLAAWSADTFMHGYSLYVSAALLGWPDTVARMVQVLGAAAAAVAVWVGFSRPRAEDQRLAVLLVAATVATPHLQAYDLVLLAAAVILLWPCAEGGIGLSSLLLYAAVWLMLFLRPYNVPVARLLVPLVFLGLLYDAARQRWQSTPSPGPNGNRNSR